MYENVTDSINGVDTDPFIGWSPLSSLLTVNVDMKTES